MSKKPVRKKSTVNERSSRDQGPRYPRHSVEASLRIPKAILDQNAGKECSDTQAAKFLNLKSAKGPFAVEISSGIKYGFLNRPTTGKLEVTDLARQILRPKSPTDVTKGYQQAVLRAPTISDVYLHYRGENFPDRQFFDNALEDTFKIPKDKLSEFKEVFAQSLSAAKLSQEHDGRIRILHSASDAETSIEGEERIQKISASADIKASDTCFVMMPMGLPIGQYYETVYRPAVEKAGLTPVRADKKFSAPEKSWTKVGTVLTMQRCWLPN